MSDAITQNLPEQVIDAALKQIHFNADGLVPAIAQDTDSGEILMMAWMNEASIRETLSSDRVCYWSRSRQNFWRKGESSGHIQYFKEMRIDCDGDTLLLLVKQIGPACHTNRPNCFYFSVQQDGITEISQPITE